MPVATSSDGTTVSYDVVGSGPLVVFVGGAFNLRDAGAPLAAELAADRTVVTYDRRGRGLSTDTRPYDVGREVEDLRAVIDDAGGRASVFGYSSGAVLALRAVADGLEVDRLYLYEPPLRFEDSASAPDADLPERLQALVDDGEPGEVVATFQREAIGLPAEVVAEIRQSPVWPHLEKLAQSVVYDAILTVTTARPSPQMAAVAVPTLVLHGDSTWPFLRDAAVALADLLPAATLDVVPSTGHDIDPVATADAVRRFDG